MLGVGGGPSTSAAVEVLRALRRAGAAVRVILSAETEAFVPALTFGSLADGDVVMPGDVYGCLGAQDFRSLYGLVKDADGLVVVPATPALIAKAAAGQATGRWCGQSCCTMGRRCLLAPRAPPSFGTR